MVKREAEICDTCNSIVSKYKCFLCDEDLCLTCAKHPYFFKKYNNHIYFNIKQEFNLQNADAVFCLNCSQRFLKKLLTLKKEELEVLLELVKNQMIVDTLKIEKM